MTTVFCHITMSLDGFVAGPDQSLEEPLGRDGERLHEWAFATQSWQRIHGHEGGERNLDAEVIDEVSEDVGAVVMGRNMFGGGPGGWDPEWIGWWGEDPPFHAPVYVLTHHPREDLELQGGNRFVFVTDGVGSAVARAREAAGEKRVLVAGGARAVQQVLAAGLLDELYLHTVPLLLGSGERLLDNVGTPTLEQVGVIASPTVTHVKYRVVH
jgi:dihydrofolate reductase